MFDKQVFITSVYNVRDIPRKQLPEVVLCGRSNVGKSSLINSLFNRKDLAKTSRTPGKTRSINYYEIDEKFYVVDLPGFGYAKTSRKEREFWSKLIFDFFKASGNIKLVFHIIDSRHKPTELDKKLNLMLTQNEFPYIFILSKTDKIKQSEKKLSLNNLLADFPEAEAETNVLFYSSTRGQGKKQLLGLLDSVFY
jgi:GTP-binding protein